MNANPAARFKRKGVDGVGTAWLRCSKLRPTTVSPGGIPGPGEGTLGQAEKKKAATELATLGGVVVRFVAC